KELGWLRIRVPRKACFHPKDGSLITAGPTGVLRWPIRHPRQGNTSSMLIGPPEPVALPRGFQPSFFSLSQNGNLLAVADHHHGQILVLELQTGKTLLQASHPGADFLEISPNGHWLASNTWGVVHGKVRAWNVNTGKQVTELAGSGAPFTFSRDSQFL